MTFQIVKIDEKSRQVVATQESLKSCHKVLASLRHDYMSGLPEGDKSLCKWVGRDNIIVKCITGKMIKYSILVN
jgi:hypothetical protein